MMIGELARRLRVTTRTLRHYESVGLLRASSIDARTGYRHYGDAELARGLRIEQLKATGLALSTIAAVLDGDVPLGEALAAHRARLQAAVAAHRRQLAVLDAMLRAPDRVLAPALVTVPATHAVVVEAVCTPAELAGTARRIVQRLRRDVTRRLHTLPTMFSARFPLDAAPHVTMRVAAHTARPCRESVVIDGLQAVAVDVVGPHALLPIAQEAAVAAARSSGLVPSGWVWEHYLDIGAQPHTKLLVPVAAAPSLPA